ncbi:MAG: type I methionyl aminopeptidase [Phycisphaerae bacterium]|nr:type I methionyl aminopeptidase [Phycisphaerae bacterium]
MSSKTTILTNARAAGRRGSRRADAARRAGGGHDGVTLRTPEEIVAIRAAGDVLRDALDRATDACVIGATTADINAAAMRVIEAAKAEALFLGYPSSDPSVHAFPACCCISVNDEIVHGIPGSRVIKDGDLVSIDCGVKLNGWCADAAVTIPVGTVSDDALALIECAQDMLATAVQLARPGEQWSAIASKMQALALDAEFGIVVEYVGHGIGRSLHEAPQVPNCVTAELLSHADFTLRPGMVLAIEPMIALRGEGLDPRGYPRGVVTRRMGDGWPVATADGSVAAHVEHTIAITRMGCEVLTLGRGQSLSTHAAPVRTRH